MGIGTTVGLIHHFIPSTYHSSPHIVDTREIPVEWMNEWMSDHWQRHTVCSSYPELGAPNQRHEVLATEPATAHGSAGSLCNWLSLFNHIIQCACFTWSIYVTLSEHVTQPNGFCRNSLLGLAFSFLGACSSEGSDNGPRTLGVTCLLCAVLC